MQVQGTKSTALGLGASAMQVSQCSGCSQGGGLGRWWRHHIPQQRHSTLPPTSLSPPPSSYSVLMFPVVSFFSVGFILSSFFSFHLLLRRTFSSTFCNEELVSVMDIYLQQKLAERDDKYEYTYLEARVNWTILPTHSFLQLIAVITRIPDHHHIEPHTIVAYKLLEKHCSKVWWWLQRVKRCRRLRCWRLEWWRRCTSARSRLHFLHSIPPPTSLR